MDEKQLEVEVHLETRAIPRERVAQIIWLHADELSDGSDARVPAAIDAASTPTRVQILREDGNRLTFQAEQFTDGVLLGTSHVLGACRAQIGAVDQLFFGRAVDEAAADLAYHRWKLHPAVEPKFMQDLDSGAPGGQSPGTGAELVGKPAPDFELQLLNGEQFRLSDHHGDVVVLDFWATWCAPCLQAMPRVDRVVQEFAGQGVKLIAVNLEEDAKQITGTLERHKLAMPVALDRDSRVARLYQVTGIPQSVVIDRTGKVDRVFVGDGPQLAEQLRASLQALTSQKVLHTP